MERKALMDLKHVSELSSEINRLNMENRMLTQRLANARISIRELEEKAYRKISKLEKTIDILKQERKKLLQDKNAIINIAKGIADDMKTKDLKELEHYIDKYLDELYALNIGSNDSNTKGYLKIKKECDILIEKNKAMQIQNDFLIKWNVDLEEKIEELKANKEHTRKVNMEDIKKDEVTFEDLKEIKARLTSLERRTY